jgi:hypothetical protein
VPGTYITKEKEILRALKRSVFTFSVPSKQCVEPLQCFKKPSMNGVLIEGAQRAEPLLHNQGIEKG